MIQTTVTVDCGMVGLFLVENGHLVMAMCTHGEFRSFWCARLSGAGFSLDLRRVPTGLYVVVLIVALSGTQPRCPENTTKVAFPLQNV